MNPRGEIGNLEALRTENLGYIGLLEKGLDCLLEADTLQTAGLLLLQVVDEMSLVWVEFERVGKVG